VQPDAVGGADLVGVRPHVAAPTGPQHDRRDDVAGPRLVVVEQPQHGIRPEHHAELLVELAAGRVDSVLAGVEPAAGERPLRRVAVEARRAPAQQEGGAATDVDHPPVEALGATRDAVHRTRLRIERIDAVLALGRIHDDDADRRVTPLADVDLPTAVATKVADDASPQAVVVGQRSRDARHAPIVVRPPGGRRTRR
jgi:hypothetical protein